MAYNSLRKNIMLFLPLKAGVRSVKKTVIICCISVLIGILLTCSTVRAAETDVIFEGNSKNFIDIKNSNCLFANFNDLYLGIDLTRTLDIHDPNSKNAQIYIRARAVKSEYQPLLKQISLYVLDDDGNVISSSNDLSQKIFLCELKGGQERSIKLRMHINSKTAKDFKSTYKKIEWIFSANEITDTSISDIPKTNGSYNSVIYPVTVISLVSFLLTLILSEKTKYF